jgi:zinc transport system permease protein
MVEFLRALTDPNVPFLRYSFLAGVLASVAFGIVGTYVVARRITYIAGAIAHCVLGGIGVALFLKIELGLTWVEPLHGALLSALLAAGIIGLVSLYGHQREDTVIGAIWATGMAIGAIFLARIRGANVDPMSYLFGDILMISRGDLWLIAGLDAVVVALAVVFYNRFQAVCFDEEFARLRGVNVGAWYLLLLCLAALTIVLLVQLVGIVMVIALLTLPAAVAGAFSRRLWQMMALSVLACLLFTGTGMAVSYSWELPSGPAIIVVASTVYLLVAALNHFRRSAA